MPHFRVKGLPAAILSVVIVLLRCGRTEVGWGGLRRRIDRVKRMSENIMIAVFKYADLPTSMICDQIAQPCDSHEGSTAFPNHRIQKSTPTRLCLAQSPTSSPPGAAG